ncbi:MAG: hypothetical protein LQ347_003577 [Umbilicaria vellea]|nr:MAG: hypothetical protein LQ347_003577 [Umbilicaria vellea]
MTVRVVFEDPSGSKGASNADEDFSAEDGNLGPSGKMMSYQMPVGRGGYWTLSKEIYFHIVRIGP